MGASSPASRTSRPKGRGSSCGRRRTSCPSDCAAIVKVTGVNYNVVNPFKCYTSYLIKS